MGFSGGRWSRRCVRGRDGRDRAPPRRSCGYHARRVARSSWTSPRHCLRARSSGSDQARVRVFCFSPRADLAGYPAGPYLQNWFQEHHSNQTIRLLVSTIATPRGVSRPLSGSPSRTSACGGRDLSRERVERTTRFPPRDAHSPHHGPSSAAASARAGAFRRFDSESRRGGCARHVRARPVVTTGGASRGRLPSPSLPNRRARPTASCAATEALLVSEDHRGDDPANEV